VRRHSDGRAGVASTPDAGQSLLGGKRLPKAIVLYVRWVEKVGYVVGRFAMYLIYPMGALMLYSTVMRVAFGIPINWIMEMSQFLLSAYYLLGGAYSQQIDAHVRMDLFYTMMKPRTRAITDAFTIFFVIFYLVVLFLGGWSSTDYAITYAQKNYTSWAPPLWPIKVIMTAGILLMLLQTIASFFRDVAIARGKPIA
jgi:TRAP-type mannitol/chloroaromatic compound transport system permease small subunit